MFRLTCERQNFLKVIIRRPNIIFTNIHKNISILIRYVFRKLRLFLKSDVEIRKKFFCNINHNLHHNFENSFNYKIGLHKFPPIFLESNDKLLLSHIRLATENVSIEKHFNWERKSDDIENIFALNRFGWLLTALIEGPSPFLASKSIFWINNWIEIMNNKTNHQAWESYSVSERLSNWPFILLILENIIELPEEFLITVGKVINKHLDYLLSKLELKGKNTNNHILNNGRGLYIGGIITSRQDAIEKGKKIFLEWTNKLIDSNGMLREHSSHYQFLIWQRYEQVYFLSKSIEDYSFANFMDKWVSKIRDGCDFFSVYKSDGTWDIPLIGDVSPDFPPSWFSPGSDNGWCKLKAFLNWTDNVKPRGKNRPLSYSQKGCFVRCDIGKVTVFWHIVTTDSGRFSHAHFDTGGFVMFYKGVQIFTDNGRFSYTDKGSYGKSALAHSTITINSMGAECEDEKLAMFDLYYRTNCTYNISENNKGFELEILHKGFERLEHPVEWRRKFSIDDNGMIITDHYKTSIKQSIDTRFQIHPDIEIHQTDCNTVNLNRQNCNSITQKVLDSFPFSRVFYKGSIDECKGCFHGEYGLSTPSITLVYRRFISGNNNNEYVYGISWE